MYIRSYSVWVSQLWYGLPGGCKFDILDIMTVFVDFCFVLCIYYVLHTYVFMVYLLRGWVPGDDWRKYVDMSACCWYCVGMLWNSGHVVMGWSRLEGERYLFLICGIIRYIGQMCVYYQIKYGVMCLQMYRPFAVCVCWGYKCETILLWLVAHISSLCEVLLMHR